jgi:[acyl-carrier-protein] S-malonyltransferase
MALALIFPGQGAQYVGMGLELANRYPEARRILDEADAVLGFAISDLIANGPEDELTRTDLSQPAILTASWMAHAVLRATVQPCPVAATAGLSLGEYTALVAAEALDFADALRLVRIRGQAMQAAAEATPSGMVALIGADEPAAAKLCQAAAQDQILTVANLNATGQVVISGAAAACERAVALAKDHGIRRAMPLKVAGAFHSPLMQPAAAKLGEALAQVRFRAPRFPVYANVTAAAVSDPAAFPDLLVKQLTAPVRWAQSVQAMHAAGITTCWELGPGKSLCGMIARSIANISLANLETPADALALAESRRQALG